jgi:hypothetical protein
MASSAEKKQNRDASCQQGRRVPHVAASGGVAANVTINIATPDADSFRRSETYITGQIARAVARGQRSM